jgi:hypothetical protein
VTASSLSTNPPGVSPARGFERDHPWDRNFFLTWMILIWAGVLSGFVPEIVQHFVKREPAYPPIIHVHGAVFVGWLALLTAQILLIRAGRWRIHQRLGVAGAGLAAIMLVVGPATAVVMDRLEFGTPKDSTPFLIVQLTDMASFAVLAGSGLALRGRPAAHKRLMLMATLYIADAGFARFQGDPIVSRFGESFWPYFAALYLSSDLLILGLGAFDLITRRRLHPAYMVAVAYVAGIQAFAVHVVHDPAWLPVASRLIGH